MNDSYIKLNNYVFAVDALVESIQADLRKGNYKISEKTVLLLSKQIKAGHEAATLLQVMKNINNKLN